MRVFVSGATGYIGGAIARRLTNVGYNVAGGVRRVVALPEGVTPLLTGDLADSTVSLAGFDAVVHAAGLGHRRGVDQAVWRRANVDAAVNLARRAAAAGVQKFVLVSTAHVHGRVHERVVDDDTPPNPMDDYAASKLEAERAVREVFGAGLTVVRPVAVIGPGCPGNIPLLLKLLRRRVPLPFGAIRNHRSFIHVDDLAALVLAVLQAEVAPATVLAAHPEAVSTPALIRALAAGLGVRPVLLPCPAGLLAGGAKLLGRGAMWQSLAGSFVADPKAALGLGWQPGHSLVARLAETARYYNTTQADI